MAHSVEARVPFLDYRLAEYAFGLPAEQKIQGDLTKAILRHALKGVIPETIRTRTDKMGFVTPERIWLAAELKDCISELVESQSFRERSYFDVDQIRQAFQAHLAGQRDLTFLAWRWINLELWLRQMIDG
jgi:asparagine synthase (glutamine-hydrolysing)